MSNVTPMRSRARSARTTGPLPETFRWGIYRRISDDRLGLEKGIDRQWDDGVARVEARGGTAVQDYPENDTSAYQKRRIMLRDDEGNEYPAYRVIRPVFQQMISDLRNGVIDGAMVYDLDRLARDPRDLEDCIEMAEHFGRLVESATPGQIDLTNSSGIAMARVLIAMAAKSSADTARRTERAHYANALEGKPVGGTRPFGWEDDKRTLRPAEADMIRGAVAQLIQGARLHEVGAAWNASGVPTTRGSKWQRQTLLSIFQNPRLYGVRTYHGEVMIGADGEPVRGLWEPLLDEETFHALQAVLRPQRGLRPAAGGHAGRKYLWSGILRCAKPLEEGLCGTAMVGYPKAKTRGPGHIYGCKPKSDGGCGGLAIDGTHVDRFLEQYLLDTLEQRQAVEGIPAEVQPWDGEADLAKAKRRLKELQQMFGAGDLERAEYLELRDIAREKVAALETDREQKSQARVEAETAGNFWDGWSDKTLQQRIDVIKRARLVAVLVKPSENRGTRRFDPDRLDPVWA